MRNMRVQAYIELDAENIPEMVALMVARRPVVNGCWDIDGNVYDAELYPFDLDLHLIHTPPDQSVTVVNGEEVIKDVVVVEQPTLPATEE